MSTGRTPSEQAAALIAMFDELGVKDAVVFGASGGGMVTVDLAARYPARIQGLVLWSAVTGPMRIWSGPLLRCPLARRSTGEGVVRLVRRFPGMLVGRAAADQRAVNAALAIAQTVFPIGPRRDGLRMTPATPVPSTRTSPLA